MGGKRNRKRKPIQIDSPTSRDVASTPPTFRTIIVPLDRDFGQSEKISKIIQWEEGSSSFNSLFDKIVANVKLDTEEYTRLHRTFHIICNQNPPHDHSEKLYLRYRDAIEEFLCKKRVLMQHADENMLEEFVQGWISLGHVVKKISKFLSYIDMFFIKRGPFPTLKEVSVRCFRDLLYPGIQSKANNALIGLINRDRQGEEIDKNLLRNVIDIYVEIGMGNLEIYEKDFESLLLLDAAAYYLHKASYCITDKYDDFFLAYLPKYEIFLEEETKRVTRYLYISSVPKLIATLQHQFLLVVAKDRLEDEQTGCRAWLRNDEVDKLSKIYTLYHEIPEGLANVVELFKEHLIAEGNTLFKRAEEDAENRGHVQEQGIFKNICKLHDKSMDYVTNCFQNHSLFSKAMNEVFDGFCNKTVAGRSTVELLATYFHNSLKNYLNKKGISKEEGRESPEKAMENTIENVMKFLRHSRERDLFAKFHQKKLVERLLFDRSSSTGYEDSMLLKFREEFGAERSSRMEKMVKDMKLAVGMEERLKRCLTTTANCGIDFTADVLTYAVWPSYQASSLLLPKEMANSVEAFKACYETVFKNRKLTWVYSLGFCQIIGTFDEKKITLTVSTYQAALLLLFNDVDRLSYREILEQLKLSKEELSEVLRSVSCKEYMILIKEPAWATIAESDVFDKEPASVTISDSDVFKFNSKFTSSSSRIKIPFIKTGQVRDVAIERGTMIDPVLVRILKRKKILAFDQLVIECAAEIKMFKASTREIKKRVDSLIDRAFFERDAEDPNIMKYLA